MIQENKELLLKDLSTRLPYGVKCDINDNKPYTLSSISNDYDGTLIRFKEQKNGFNIEVYLSEVKPYLFPLSSMTEEQKRNLTSLFNCHVEITQYEIKFADYQDSNMDNWNKVFNWCYKNHFDINSLIPMNLAIDATNLNIY